MLHLSTPLARLGGLSAVAVLNVPLWVLLAACTLAWPGAWPLTLVVAVAGQGAFAGALLARFGRLGGNLGFSADGVDLDGKRVVGLLDWSIEGGWLAVSTPNGPLVRFGDPDEVGEAVERLTDAVGVDCPIDDRMDGFAVACRARAPRMSPVVALTWAVVGSVAGLAPLVMLAALPQLLSLLWMLPLFGLVVIAVNLPAAALAAHAVHAFESRGALEVELLGNVMTVSHRGRERRYVLRRPGDVVFDDDGTGCVLQVEGEHFACTSALAKAVRERLSALRRLEGDATSVPDALSRVRRSGQTE